MEECGTRSATASGESHELRKTERNITGTAAGSRRHSEVEFGARIRQFISPQLKAALWYAAAGIPVFPLHYPVAEGVCSCGDPQCAQPARHPLTRHGMHDATSSPAWIERWWSEHPKANVGVLCGQPGPAARSIVDVEGRCSLAALDVDLASGGAETLEQLSAGRVLPATRRVLTGGGGGFHLYYRLPAEREVRSALLGPGVELRCRRAYVVGAGSRHISMTTYRFDDSSPYMLADFPDWLAKPIPADSGKNLYPLP